jgi:hypothetical protein
MSRKRGLNEDDLIIQITYKDESGKIFKPVLNLNDNIIRGVLAGINELVGEDKALRSLGQVKVNIDTKFCRNCGIRLPQEAIFCSACGSKQEQS